jgi:methylenetetrahydrofolate reductase (NADPH)
MTRIDTLLAETTTTSFEFFPPKTDEGRDALRVTVRELEPLSPSFVSVTYGAGGATRERTHDLVIDMLTNTNIPPMAHLTTVAHTRSELVDILTRYRDAGVANIMALRGDAPQDDPNPVRELRHAAELVTLAREVGGDQFAIGVAAHPEGHPESPSLETDRRFLAEKCKLADFAVTQFFFHVDVYLRLVDDLDRHGCDTPVIPGIMPVTNVSQIERFAALSGTALPTWLKKRLAQAKTPDEVETIGVEVATELCADLLAAGAPGLHFYTLNRSQATRRIYAALQNESVLR